MSRLTTFLFAVALLAGMTEVRAAPIVIADARGDYVPGATAGDPGIVPATGTGEWRYLASDTLNPTLDPNGLDVLPWDGVGSYILFTGGGHATRVGDNLADVNLASDEIGPHPGAVFSPTFAVVRWIAGAGEMGAIDINGNFRKTSIGGNGVTFDIFVDGSSIFSQAVAFDDTVGFALNESVTIGVGSTVDFVIGSIGDDTADPTALKATISAIPEPSSLALFGLGAFGLVGYGWRRKHVAWDDGEQNEAFERWSCRRDRARQNHRRTYC